MIDFELSEDQITALQNAKSSRKLLSEKDAISTIIETLRDKKVTHRITHIYTEDLNKNGTAIQDSFVSYLGKDAIQSSHLKQALCTPLHYAFARSEDKEEIKKLEKEKPHLNLGTFIHQCILEPTKFGRVTVEPKHSLTSTEGVNNLIDFWEDLLGKEEDGQDKTIKCIEAVQAQNLNIDKIDGKRLYLELLKKETGITPVTEEHFAKIAILKSHLDHYGGGIIKKLVKGSKREISFYYEHENGLNLKVRPDALQFKENIGVDAIISIKSTASEDLRAFIYQSAKLHYDLTESMYQDVVRKVTGRNFDTTITIMLQTVDPFGIAVLVWSKTDIEVGKYKYESAMQTALKVETTGVVKGYDSFADNEEGLILLELPNWNNKELLPQN
jgi:hypothetical protein